jgi:hypothetical protein
MNSMEDPMALARLLIVAALISATPAAAHHGWLWATDGEFEITGVVVEAKLGNPHGLVTIEVDGDRWVVEVGQPWRNARAGLDDAELAPGTVIRAEGHRSADPAQNLMKAERIVIGDEVHDLYPDRD